MTVLAVIILAIWAIGIIAFTVAVPSVGRAEHPFLDAAFVTDPVRACLLTAVIAVAWPGVLIAAGLIRLADRRAR